MPVTIVHPFQVTIPAGTLVAAPLVTLTQFPPNVVRRVEWRFPAGCNGRVGIQIGARAVPIIPGDRTQFFVRSGDSQGIDLEDLHTTGDWSVIGYNLGAFPHTILVTFHCHRNVRAVNDLFLIGDTAAVLAMGES